MRMNWKFSGNKVDTARILGILFLVAAGAVPALAAGPVFWDWPADRSFDEVELDGAAVSPAGHLEAGLASREAGPVGPEVFWRIIPDGKGGYFTGTGHGGEIHHTTSGNESRLVTRLEGSEVFSLQLLDGGDLLAGCGPEGQLYRINKDGEAVLVGSVDGGYIWSMAADPGHGSVWLAAGSPAAVYRYGTAKGDLEKVLDLPAQNALDLVFDDQGRLLVSTQGPGLIYRIDTGHPDQPRLLFETPQDEARQFITGPEGGLFVLALNTDESTEATGGLPPGAVSAGAPPALLALMMEGNGSEIPRAALFRLEESGLVVPWWVGEVDLMIAGWSERWGWLGGGPLADDTGRSVLYGLTVPSGSRPLAEWYGGDILDLQVTRPGSDKEEVIVCQAHPGSVTVLGSRGDLPRQAISPVLDGGLPVKWGRLSWNSEGRGDLAWSVRGGNRAEPDDSWTEWSGTWTGSNQEIPLDPCRFLQWRVEFPSRNGDDPVRVTSVSVSAWQDNRPPVITSFDQEYLKAIHLGMMSNHNDNITQTFRSGLKAEFSRTSAEDGLAGPERTALGRSIRVFTWDGSDPNGDRIVWDLAYRRSGEAAWREILAGRSEPLGSWETDEVPDGQYDLKLTASDRPDNPGHLAESVSRILGPVTVDNTPPEISGFQLKKLETGVQVSLKATDKGGDLAYAQLRLPDGTVERFDPVDGICDSPSEKFEAVVTWPRPGHEPGTEPWFFRVEVWDMGGNPAAAEGETP